MIINFSDEPIIYGEKSIFLAGPTRRKSNFQKSWRKIACDLLEEMGYDGIVYVPEFKDEDMPVELEAQASWERVGLENAKAIVFYLPRELPDMPGFTTNVEFGMWLARKPNETILCCPYGYVKNKYLEWLYTKEKPNSPIFRTLKEILENAITINENM